MALITCPECGNAISSTAKACVHCGCKFSVCPDCGKAVSANVPACPSCGRNMLAPPVQTAQYVQSAQPAQLSPEEKTKRDTEALNRRVAKDTALWKKFSLGDTIAMLLGVVFFVITIIILEEKDTELLTMGIIFWVLSLLSVIAWETFELLQIRLITNCAQWIKDDQIDVRSYLKSHMAKTEKEQKSFELISHAMFFLERPKDKIWTIIDSIGYLLIDVLSDIFLMIFLLNPFDGDGWYIAAIIIFVAEEVIHSVVGFVISKHHKNWAWYTKEKFRKEEAEQEKTKQSSIVI